MNYTYNPSFCKIYDTYGWNYYAEFFAEKLLAWMHREGITPSNMVDLGCGSGILCGLLHEAGIPSTGMDLSPGMLSIARTRYPDIPFELGDMTTYEPSQKYDLVTSTYDAINHLLDLSLVRQTFSHIVNYVADDGYFVFDLLKDEETESTEAVEIEERGDGTLQFQVSKDAEGFLSMELMLRRGDECRHIETVHERVYDPQEIVKLLYEVGFSNVILGDTFPGEESGHGSAWIVIAKKEE